MRFARLRDLRSPNAAPIFVRLEGPTAHVLTGAPWLGSAATGETLKFDEADLLCPVTPSKVLCIGRNYAAHAKELGNEVPAEPLLFLKPPSSLLDPRGTIVLPKESTRVEHEAELGVVIGKRSKNLTRESALEAVFGFTAVGDITARDLQKKDGQWARAKGFDTFCPVGPWIETQLEPSQLRVMARVNGVVKQDGPTSDMIFDVPSLLAYTSRMMTLEPGDILVTGTPEGVGPLAPGDELEIEVSSIGILRSRVAAA